MTAYFDAAAITWDTKQQRVAQAKAIAEIIELTIPLSKDINALEFGCGTGLLGFNLIDKVGELTFSDTSRGMLSEVANKIRNGSHKTAKILDLNTAKIDAQYNLIFSSMVFHHIPDHTGTIMALIGSLHAGGYICICDLDKEDGTFHSKEIVPHHGFERYEIEQLFLNAGLDLISSQTGFINKKIINDKEVDFPVFVIIAKKNEFSIERNLQ